MRYIDYVPAQLSLPSNWQAEVAALEADIAAETDPKKRAELIDDNADYWRAIKPELAKLFNHKCWYTEAPQQGTDVDVDHYRPKKRVAEVKGTTSSHSGYWWLAFKLDNYRYSCICANRRRKDVETGETGGKADHFPLWDESKRATTPDCDCDDELPMLLDPCRASDVALLTFKSDGEAMPKSDEDKMPIAFARADKSIEFYNLNHTDFVRARIDLRDEMQREVDDARKYFNKLERGEACHAAAYENTISRLRRMRSESAPYSGFCVAYLDQYKAEDFLDGVFM